VRLKNAELWNSFIEKNQDPYGMCCVNVANRVMELLEENDTPLHDGYHPDIHTAHGLICKADKSIDAGGITGFMANAVAHIVAECHERGEEFRKSWNNEYGHKGEGTVNPALFTIATKNKTKRK
jgi:hypothetical protein